MNININVDGEIIGVYENCDFKRLDMYDTKPHKTLRIHVDVGETREFFVLRDKEELIPDAHNEGMLTISKTFYCKEKLIPE